MSDFCKQCSLDMFGEDFGDMANITTQEIWDGQKACVVLCEGCGPIQVDPQGFCVSYCSENHADGQKYREDVKSFLEWEIYGLQGED